MASGRDSVVVRAEEPADRDGVFGVNEQAFETDLEARLVDALRGVAPTVLSLVAELRGRIVGHILFTPVEIDSNPEGRVVLGLGPMAVDPELQRQGIGGALVRRGLEACREAGAAAVVVLGHPDYYPRFGFEPAAAHGLRYRNEELDPYFKVLELVAGALDGLSGEVHYRPEFEAAEGSEEAEG